MKQRLFRLGCLTLLLLGVVSTLGGSVLWSVLGLNDDLAIEGNAKMVKQADPGLGKSWREYGGDKGGSRYVAADQITPANIDNLAVAWTHRSAALKDKSDDIRARSALQTTPILVEDALVFCTQFNEVIALDPGTGAEKWRYDPKISVDARPANQFTCRGVSYWSEGSAESKDAKAGNCSSRLFMGTVDARLIALDARSGKLCADFGDDGAVQIEPSISLRWPGEFQITSAPAILGDMVISGTSIGDNLRTDAPVGTVHAFDVRTGAAKWTFNPVKDATLKPTGHANVWSTMSVDEERGLVFLPTSSASPDYFGGNRPGDNQHANSVVALNADTGTVTWAFQTVHHDVWDYDISAQPGLYSVWRDGKRHDVVAQVTKMGLVFVLDRDSGKPFLPIEERKTPQGGAKGELLSPTQPFPVNTPPIVPNRLNPDDAFGITLWDKWSCRSKLKKLRAEGLYTPPMPGSGTLSYPFTGGGANWGSAAFDPSRNLLVVNMNNIAQVIRLHPATQDREKASEISHGDEFAPMEGAPFGMSRAPVLSPLGLPCSPAPWGVLAGIDLATGKIVWRQTLGTTEDLAPGGLALGLGTPSFGGPIITGSGVGFIAATMDDYLRAFDVATGKELWKGRLPAGGQATPMSYVWKGRQYVVIAAGGHARAGTKLGDYLIAFALPE